ncbi:MAG: YbaK/EbsC family protein [Candidatus Promineifilaceae bacterium]|nr:YbaK/EbsC family protein [Candidatus Promineifilaceae bacterium]
MIDPLAAPDLERFIREQQIEAEIIFLEEKTPTVETAAEAVGVAPRQIVKSLLFMLKEGEGALRPLLVVSNGPARVNYKRLADHLDLSRRRVRIASPEQVLAHTGYRVGAVPPFGHPQPLPTVIDAGVLEQEEIYGGGGAINALVHLTVRELQRVVEAEIVDVAD